MFVHDGRPDRSTVLLLLLTVDRSPAVAADSFGDDILDFLSLPTILHLGEDSFKSEPN